VLSRVKDRVKDRAKEGVAGCAVERGQKERRRAVFV
jgi:hypothetical protein